MNILFKNCLLATVAVFVFIGCGDDEKQPAILEVKSLIVKEAMNDTITIDKSKTLQVTVETTPPNQHVWYYSSDANVFSVSQEGLIAAADNGGYASLIITAQKGAEWIKKSVTLMVYEQLDSIRVIKSKSKIKLKLGQNVDLSHGYFTFFPSTATHKTIIFESENPTIVSITPEGKLIGHKKGTAYVVARSAENKNVPSVKIEIEVSPLLNNMDWTATAQYSDKYNTPFYLFDNRNYSFWSNYVDNKAPKIPCWVVIDLKKIVTFDQIGLVQNGGTEKVEIYISESEANDLSHDDPSFKLLGSIVVSDFFGDESLFDLFPKDEKKARYIKLNFVSSSDDGYVSLNAMNVYYQR